MKFIAKFLQPAPPTSSHQPTSKRHSGGTGATLTRIHNVYRGPEGVALRARTKSSEEHWGTETRLPDGLRLATPTRCWESSRFPLHGRSA